MSLEQTDAESARFAVAPRVTLADMESKIAHKFFSTGKALTMGLDVTELANIPDEDWEKLGILTICLLVMRNGFMLVGKSAPASAENFNADYGKQLAYEDAIRQLWQLEGYALREELARG